MFSDDLILRKELLELIGTSFDNILEEAVYKIKETILSGNCLFFAGNGGSAAEAQHMSAEYLATLNHKNFRRGFKSIALTTDTSFITAWTNDFGYEKVFRRQIEILGAENDTFFAYSTSGTSKNIISAIECAREKNIKVLGFSGNDGGKMKEICDLCFIVPSSKTALIQELHTMLGHEICKRVEKEIVFSE